MTSELKPWRYTIKHGPEGEASYAWVYDDLGEMVGTMKIHKAKKIVDTMNTRAVPDVPELDVKAYLLKNGNVVQFREGWLHDDTFPLVLYSQAAEIITAKDKEIERLRAIALSLCDHMEMVNGDLFDRDKSHQNPNISSMRLAIDEARAALSGKEIEDDNPSEQTHFLHHLKELAEENARAAKEAEVDIAVKY